MPKTEKYAIAVLISDIHFNLKTIDIASAALQQAYDYANDADLPLIIAGDLHDTKANIRGECINAINKILSPKMVQTMILVGNHDLINEKSDENSLGFIKNAEIVSNANKSKYEFSDFALLPYQTNPDNFKKFVHHYKGIIICHQGLKTANSGEYFQDKSAVDYEDVKDFRIISGHYHARQTIGKWDYIGNPYTLTFGEAEDPEKGYQILYNDGSLKFIPTNLRRHAVISVGYNNKVPNAEGIFWTLPFKTWTENDLLWVKVHGTKEQLNKWTKEKIAKELKIKQSFKLELIPDKIETKDFTPQSKDQKQLFDEVIQNQTGITEAKKKQLKKLWKQYAS